MPNTTPVSYAVISRMFKCWQSAIGSYKMIWHYYRCADMMIDGWIDVIASGLYVLLLAEAGRFLRYGFSTASSASIALHGEAARHWHTAGRLR